jgi:hypothetical protein
MPGEGAAPEKSVEAKDKHHSADKPPDSMWSLLYRWIAGRPNWVQNTAILILVLAVAAGVGTYAAIKLAGLAGSEKASATPTPTPAAPEKARQVTAAGSVYVQGTEGQPPPGKVSVNDPTLIAAAKKLIAESKHGEWHDTHREDPHHPEKEPPWQPINSDPDNYVMYRYYANTDKCVAILRKANGVASPTQWLQDPNYLDGVRVQISSSQSGPKPSVAPPESLTAAPLALAIPWLASTQFPLPDAQLTPQSLQGPCADPHPGAFTWWWGPPVDQCWSPLYRRFGDACTHYQLFNRCANAWDGRIFWVSCTPGPYGHF